MKYETEVKEGQLLLIALGPPTRSAAPSTSCIGLNRGRWRFTPHRPPTTCRGRGFRDLARDGPVPGKAGRVAIERPKVSWILKAYRGGHGVDPRACDAPPHSNASQQGVIEVIVRQLPEHALVWDEVLSQLAPSRK